MYSLVGATIFLAIAIMTVLVACGLPFGEFTMGGQYRILPPKLRVMSVVCLFIQLFAVIIILQMGGFVELWFPFNITKYICFFFALYLSFNSIMNLFSKSKKERYVMTPLSIIAAICFWLTALQITL